MPALRTCHVLLVNDISGSMKVVEADLRRSTRNYLETLAKFNRESVDFSYKVKLIFFNSSVRELSPEFLEPSQLLEVLDDSDFTCSGGTAIGKLFNVLDGTFSRSSLLKGIQAGDPLPIVITISDMMETDTDVLDSASRKLYNNTWFNATNRLVLYLGNASRMDAALKLAKDADHLLDLDRASTDIDLAKLLVPVMASTTLVATERTHTKGSGKTPRELAEEQVDSHREASYDADKMKLPVDELKLAIENALRAGGFSL